jgi:putative membrane protein
MQINFFLLEISIIILFLIFVYHSIKRGKKYLLELIAAATYGLLLELIGIHILGTYIYGEFLVKIYGAPISIALGWGVIIYTAMVTTDRLSLKEKTRPFMVALLGLNIDLSMDIIAIREGLWKWSFYGRFFGVPIGNFFSWFIVIVSFSYFLYRFRRNKKTLLFYPFIAILLSLIILILMEYLFLIIQTQLCPLDLMLFLSIIVISAMYILIGNSKINMNNELDWKIFFGPAAFHGCFLILLLVRPYKTPLFITISLCMAIIGILIHLLPSFNTLFNSKVK